MITTSVNQDRDFISRIISSTLLEDSMNFIKDNFEPEDIFGEEKMKEWAENNGYIEEE